MIITPAARLCGPKQDRTASARPKYLDRINKIYKMLLVFNLVNLVNHVKKFRHRLRVAAGTMIKAGTSNDGLILGTLTCKADGAAS